MKTTKYFLCVLLLGLASVSFGQRSFHMERLSHNQHKRDAQFYADKNLEYSHIDLWTHDTQGLASKKVSYDIYESRDADRTIYVEQVEVLYEERLRLESWMTEPFDCSVAEEELYIESWMITPFDTEVSKEDPGIDSRI